jgi:NAD(P)-dependent dehydrogenase (short-subunit alcohol dehydrogenase family)
MSSPSDQRIILITGASQGLGLALATKLASFEHTHVLLSAQSLESGEEAARSIHPVETSAITPLGLDINDDNSIRTAVSDITDRFGRLDVLVNNAGIFPDRPSKPGENVFLNDSGEVNFRDKMRQTFETNVISPLQLTESLVPLLLNSGDARVIFITSDLGSLTRTLDENDPYFGFYAPAYKCSKAALNMVMAAESVKLKSRGVKVNATCPGAISTAMNGFREGLGTVEEGIVNTLRLIMEKDTSTGTFTAWEKDHVATRPW